MSVKGTLTRPDWVDTDGYVIVHAEIDRRIQNHLAKTERLRNNKLTVSYVLLVFLDVPDCV